MNNRIDILQYSKDEHVKTRLKAQLAKWTAVFPPSKTASIFIKLNLNSDMNALTGNTTDLRIVIAVIEFLKDAGYSKIVIGDGTNFGFAKNGINVIERLNIDKVGKRYGVRVVDLNQSDGVQIDLSGVKAMVARECVETDFFINIPKLKTHFEAWMSVCLKNLVGCLIGKEKRKAHVDLRKGIFHLNTAIKTHLHIVDGLIAMEGFGPSRGVPVNLGTIVIGQNPFYIDTLCARLAGFWAEQVPVLAYAKEAGVIEKGWDKEIDSILKDYRIIKLKPPVTNIAVKFILRSDVQKLINTCRNAKWFKYLMATGPMGWALYRLGIRQDEFSSDALEWGGGLTTRDLSLCGVCTKCADYCPLDLKLPADFNPQECIECLYCFMVCPKNVIEFKGKLGFAEGYLKKYGEIIKKIC